MPVQPRYVCVRDCVCVTVPREDEMKPELRPLLLSASPSSMKVWNNPLVSYTPEIDSCRGRSRSSATSPAESLNNNNCCIDASSGWPTSCSHKTHIFVYASPTHKCSDFYSVLSCILCDFDVYHTSKQTRPIAATHLWSRGIKT